MGGYSKGAVLINDNYTAFFISLVDNNLTNFNTVSYAGYWEIIATTDINDWVKPKTITSSTNNTVDNTGHTHNIDKASTSKSGIVQLTNALDSDSETLGLTAKAGKTLKTLINALTSNLQNYIPNSKNQTLLSLPVLIPLLPVTPLKPPMIKVLKRLMRLIPPPTRQTLN
ncbi:tail fiber protein [Gallibacterium anatis]|uniref:tail fiber protein n=1 Tax=Gallibacterium anatis TaxID=750 RepID=UPI000E1C18C4